MGRLQGESWEQCDITAFASGIQGDGVVSGLAVTEKGTPDMGVSVAAGSCVIGSATYTEGAATNLVIDNGDATHDRKDLITYDATADSPAVVKGTAATPPLPPAIPDGDILLAVVLVEQSESTSILNFDITEGRVFVSSKYFQQTIPIKMNSKLTVNATAADKVFVAAVLPTGLISTNNDQAKKTMLLITGTYLNIYAGENALDCATATHNQWQYIAGGAGAYADLINAGTDGQMLDEDFQCRFEGAGGAFSMMFDISSVADDDIDAAISIKLQNARAEQASMEIVLNAFLIVTWQV